MAAWEITVGTDELDTVGAVLATCAPTETAHDGVWVRHQGGVRVWSCTLSAVRWEVTGVGVDDPLEARCLPGRLVWHARDLAHGSPTSQVTLSVPDGLVGLAESEIGTAVIDLPANPSLPDIPRFVVDAATATTTVAALHNLIGRSLMPPIGAPDARPPVILVVAAGQIVSSVDWVAHDGLRSTYRIPADTAGEARSVVPVGLVMDLLRNLDGDDEVTIRFADDLSVPLLITSGAVRAAVDRREAGALRHHDTVGQALADASRRPCRILDRGVFSVEFADRTFRVELADTTTETIRITSALCDGLIPSRDLLGQINELNAALVGARVWVDEGAVIAGMDIPCTALADIGPCLAGLVRQLAGFDVYLTAIGEVA